MGEKERADVSKVKTMHPPASVIYVPKHPRVSSDGGMRQAEKTY